MNSKNNNNCIIGRIINKQLIHYTTITHNIIKLDNLNENENDTTYFIFKFITILDYYIYF